MSVSIYSNKYGFELTSLIHHTMPIKAAGQ